MPEISNHIDGNNADLMVRVHQLYPLVGLVVDVTYGMGSFWKKIKPEYFISSDISPRKNIIAQIDFRRMPYQDASIDIIVLDPPYMHNPGKRSSMNSRYNNHATTASFYHWNIVDLYRGGMIESKRCLKPHGLLMVKCKDEIEQGRQHFTSCEIWQISNEIGMYPRDRFILKPKSIIPSRNKGKQLHSRKAESYLWILSNDKGPRGVIRRDNVR